MQIAQADYLLIPLLDGSHAVAQVLEGTGFRPDSLFCALTLRRSRLDEIVTPLSLPEILAFAFVDPALAQSGAWPNAGFDQIPKFAHVFDPADFKWKGFDDFPIHDAAVIEAFVNACSGLYPWNAFGDLFDNILRTDIDRPPMAKT